MSKRVFFFFTNKEYTYLFCIDEVGVREDTWVEKEALSQKSCPEKVRRETVHHEKVIQGRAFLEKWVQEKVCPEK